MRSIQLIYGRTLKGAHPAKPLYALQGDFGFTPKNRGQTTMDGTAA